MEVGDQVLVAGQKNGIVRFYGKTDFAPGPPAGLQLLLYTVYCVHWELSGPVSNTLFNSIQDTTAQNPSRRSSNM